MRGFWIAALSALACGCGGSVVVDGAPGEGGAGGTTTSGPEGCFFTPEPLGGIDPSTCTASGGDTSCSESCLDHAGHAYVASCTAESCRCERDGITICTCAAQDGATFCAGGVPPCCPPPWHD